MILHLITNLEGRAGAEKMLCRLVNTSRDSHVMIVPLMSASLHNRELISHPKVTIEPLGANSPLSMALTIPRIARVIRSAQPEAVICWMYHAMAVGVLAGKLARTNTPIIWNVRQSLDDLSSMTANTRLAVNACKRLSGSPAGIIYNSHRAHALHEKFGYGSKNAVVIPNGFILPDAVPSASGKARVFGIAGRFHPQKDHETFFKAAAMVSARYPAARFKAAGAGLTHDNSAVVALINAAGLHASKLELCGEVEDMAGFYGSIDALVLSSRTEGFPNVIAEAMSYGKPVVTTDVGDAAVIVGEPAQVAPVGEPAKLAAAICALADLPPDKYAKLSASARQRVEREYNMEWIARQYEQYIDSLIRAP